MSKKLNIDDSIREKLDGFSVAPPSHVWDNINTQLIEQRKKRRLAYAGWLSAAAVVVLAFIAGWYFNDKTVVEEPAMAQQQITPESNDESAVSPNDNSLELGADQLAEAEDEINTKTKLNNTTTIAESKSFAEVTLAAEQNYSETDQLVAERAQENYSLLQRIKAEFTTKNTNVTLEHRSTNTEIDKSFVADEMLIAANLRNLYEQKEEEHGWIVGAHVSPGYSSHSASHNDTYARNMTYDSDNGGSNVGGGISVQYKTSKRLRVESGFYYAKDGQKANNSFNLFASDNDLVYSVAPEVGPGFSNLVQTGSSGIAMNSTAGIIEMKTAPRGARISANLENTADAAANRLYSDGEFSQVFEFVEVPLYLRYSVLDKKVGIELLGGINAGFVIGNNAYLDNDYGVQNIGSTADISTLNFSGTIGVGVNYMLGKHFSFALEPRLNYYLNSINSNPDVDYRPYRIGVYTGVYYEF
ncbi:porin family protein [Draconibacterium halophilum]|uniref:PorT family protein n=1 Tax=Draconibacterium halophilum TaxID=2706887 RepID=A0A6C0R9V1_9BACT|nr:outer membrane beta-barrel protein [Draconibacterium halophilum]QIA07318.1 PorT family protein [Draconibacterium halophilum]